MPAKTKTRTKKPTAPEPQDQSPGTPSNPIRSSMSDRSFHMRENLLIRCPECGTTHARPIFGWDRFPCGCGVEIRHPSFYSSGAPSHGTKTRVFSINLPEETIAKLCQIAEHHGTKKGGFIRFCADLIADACYPLDRMP